MHNKEVKKISDDTQQAKKFDNWQMDLKQCSL